MPFLRALIGLFALLAIAFLFSRNRKAIDWRLVGLGVLLQLILGVLVLKVPFVYTFFTYLGKFFNQILSFTEKGSVFVFGDLTNSDNGFIFAVRVLPIIIFFSSLTTGLYYLGIIQKLVYGFAWLMKRTLRISGPESLNAAGNVVLGQTEAPLLIKPYLAKMTPSQILCIMIAGMATIAGSVMGAYVMFLGGDDQALREYYAAHLLTASIMNAPAAIVFSKMLFPETDPSIRNAPLEFSAERPGVNIIDAIAIGAGDGLRLAANVAGMLIAFIAVIAMMNSILFDLIGANTSLNEMIHASTDGKFPGLTMQYVLGQIFRPVAFLIGVEWKDTLIVGGLLGQKVVINEFVAYSSLAQIPEGTITHTSKMISTYALCSFANFASIAIQIAGLGSLAPEKRSTVSQLGLLAVLGGTLATLLSATWAAVLI